MKTLTRAACFTVTFALGGVLASTPALAQRMSCQELDAAIVYIDTLADTLEDATNYSARLDAELLNLAEGAAGLALLENDSALADYADQMISAWDNRDADRFLLNADRTADRYEFFLERDC